MRLFHAHCADCVESTREHTQQFGRQNLVCTASQQGQDRPSACVMKTEQLNCQPGTSESHWPARSSRLARERARLDHLGAFPPRTPVMGAARLARQRGARPTCLVDTQGLRVDRKSTCAPQLGAIENQILCLGEVLPRLLATQATSDRLFHRIFLDDNIRRWCTASRTAPRLAVATRLDFRFRSTSRIPPSIGALGMPMPSPAEPPNE